MSLRARLLGLTLRATVRPLISAWSVAPGLPWPYAAVDYAGLLPRPARGTTFTTTEVGGARVLEVAPAGCREDRRVLYLPGGAFLVGGHHLHRSLLSRIAAATGARVLAVDYRKLPAHPISTSVEDCLVVYRALLDERPADDLVLMGDSAGGFLALAVLAAAQAEGLPVPAAVAVLSPLCEVRTAQRDGRRTSCAVLGPAAINAMLRLAASRESGPAHRHPRDLLPDGLPPILLQAAGRESLFPEIKQLAHLLDDVGARCTLQAWDVDVHVFQAAGWVPEARDALRALGEFCDRAWTSAVPLRPRSEETA